ncbi:MAG: helix-turn-helix transcriptional regulator [Cyclobacteriaceae bacterium]
METTSENPALIDCGSVKKTVDLILLGKETRILSDGPMDYYFRIDNIRVTSEYGKTANLDALYCDAFYRSKFISDFKLYSMGDLLKMLDTILEDINVVFYQCVVKNWKHDPELRDFLFKNYRIHHVSLSTVLGIRREGLFFPKQRPLNSVLTGISSLPLNQIRISLNAKQERLKKGLKIVELAERSGLVEKTIRNIENPYKSNYLDSLEKVAKGLQIDISRLLG